MDESLMNSKIRLLSTPAEVHMDDDWYGIASLNHFWIRARFDAVMRIPAIKSLKNARLLEIGCGHGLVMQQFETLDNVVVDGCDLNMLALNKVEKVKGDLYSLNIFENPSDLLKRYDGILLMDVIEHIDDDAGFVSESCKYLKTNGLVVVDVPALNALFSKYDATVGHKRRYTKKMMEEVFSKNNIEKISIDYWGLFMIPIAVVRKFLLKYTPDRRIIAVGFTPPGPLSNWLLNGLMRIENWLFRSRFLGTSVVAVGRLPGRRRRDRGCHGSGPGGRAEGEPERRASLGAPVARTPHGWFRRASGA
jgi:SAM-dependent methyltransferase